MKNTNNSKSKRDSEEFDSEYEVFGISQAIYLAYMFLFI